MRSLLEFIFPHRLHRVSYFLRGVAADGVMGFIYSYISVSHSEMWWLAISIILVYGIFFIVLPRIRDVGMSGWWLLVYFIPVVNIWLAIILLFRAPVLSHPKPSLSFRPAAVIP